MIIFMMMTEIMNRKLIKKNQKIMTTKMSTMKNMMFMKTSMIMSMMMPAMKRMRK